MILAVWRISEPVVVLGAATGLTYGLMAVGLVLVYRSSRIVNFAHAATGGVASAALGALVVRDHLPYWSIFPMALAIGAACGILIEVVAVRRLRNVASIMSIVATLGAGAFLTSLAVGITGAIPLGSTYPEPPGVPEFSVGPLLFTPAYSAQLIGGPVIVLGLALFLRYSRYGIAMRAAASNPVAATLRGISTNATSAVAWGIAGAISAYAAVLAASSQGIGSSQSALNLDMLLRALVAAALARFVSLPIALLAGVLLGDLEQLILWNTNSPSTVDLVLFSVLFFGLLLHTPGGVRDRSKIGSWVGMRPWAPPTAALRNSWPIRNGGLVGGVLIILALASVRLLSNGDALVFTEVIAYALVGLSVYIVTGLTGQLSLAQFALAGVGGSLSYQLTRHGMGVTTSLLVAALGVAAVATVLACTAVRIRGLMLAITTLGFALMCQEWLFQRTWSFGGGFGEGVSPGRPTVLGRYLQTSGDYYLFAIPVFAVGWWLTMNVSRGGLRRAFIAVRDNEDAARAFGLHVGRLKLEAFAIGGFLAGLGGALYTHALFQVGPSQFPADAGITVVAMTVLGGLSLPAGALFGALYLVALPELVHLDAATTAASTIGWLVLILYWPGGIPQLIAPIRAWGLAQLSARIGTRLSEESGPPSEHRVTVPPLPATASVPARAVADRDVPILEACELAKRFGGIQAVRNVSFDVRAGEILGLIGPNGAGKTTLFELLSGFTRPSQGTVRFGGRDVTHMSPEQRNALGLIRSFQDAPLFPTMTVHELAKLALDRSDRTRLFYSLIGAPRARRLERVKNAKADSFLASMGLDVYGDSPIASLSTGTRRIVEIACVIAMRPSVVLLDEPSSGIAQRETESLADVIRGLRDRWGITVVLIEHDIPLVSLVSDRMVAMQAGEVIAIGPPDEVCGHPDVIAGYLGTDSTALHRSSHRSPDVVVTVEPKGETSLSA